MSDGGLGFRCHFLFKVLLSPLSFSSEPPRLLLPWKAWAESWIKRREKHIPGCGCESWERTKEGQKEVSCAGLAGTFWASSRTSYIFGDPFIETFPGIGAQFLWISNTQVCGWKLCREWWRWLYFFSRWLSREIKTWELKFCRPERELLWAK